MSDWKCILRLNEQREVISGSANDLAAAVKRGADLRSYTTFDYSEHMAAPESGEHLVQEMMSFGVVYWLEGGHVAGIQNSRYPANGGLGFGDYPSLSFFLNNENGRNGIARAFLQKRTGMEQLPGGQSPTPVGNPLGKYKATDSWDTNTMSLSENFTYDFGEYGWWVNDVWQEVLAHDGQGNVLSGSLENLQDEFRAGKRLKVGVADLCASVASDGAPHIPHEVFIQLHSIYNHQDSGFLGGESDPIVRVAPGVPLKYKSGNWNFGWILPRTDGTVHQLVIDPYSRQFSRTEGRFTVRWFVD